MASISQLQHLVTIDLLLTLARNLNIWRSRSEHGLHAFFEVFWVVTPYSFVLGYQRFGQACAFHLQGEDFTMKTLVYLVRTTAGPISFILKLRVFVRILDHGV